MGAVLSLPLIPVQMAATGISTFIGSSMANLACGGNRNNASSAREHGVLASYFARLLYAIFFVLNCLLSWLSLSDWAISKLERLSSSCEGDNCTGFTTVYRLQTSLGMLHALLAITLAMIPAAAPMGVKHDIQAGWWKSKILTWIVLVAISFQLPPNFWVFWGNYIALFASFAFVLIGLVLLVDCAHSWAETCMNNIEEADTDGDAKLWRSVLVGSTLGMYFISLAMTVVMYFFFAGSQCSMNQAAITLNLILAIIVSVLSVHPRVQEYNPRAGLAQSAMVSIYCTYLTISAVSSEPDDKMCNPFVRSKGTRTFSIVVGALFTFLAIAYTTTRAASYGGGNDDLDEDTSATEAAELRQQALRQAVADGTLPPSALEDEEWHNKRDTALGTSKPSYNYILFHLVFFLATQYTATLLTMNVEKDLVDGFVPVGRTYFASWMKIISSWICFGLYAWSLLAPVIMPDRFY